MTAFDSDQERIIFSELNKIMVYAGPGSGKTSTLIGYLAHLIKDENVPPQQILAMTFTKKAGQEMCQRLAGTLNTDPAMLSKRMALGTIHHFCVQVLKKEHLYLPYTQYFGIREDIKPTVRRAVTNVTGQEKPDAEFVAWLVYYIGIVKNYNYSKEYIREYYPDKFTAILEAYDKICEEENVMGFDDLLVNTYRLLANNPELREKYRKKYPYILVDEVQDTNKIQFDIIRLLCDENTHILCCGDEDQSIYRFRGGRVQNIEDFITSFPDMGKYYLERNYRSTPQIVEAAKAVI